MPSFAFHPSSKALLTYASNRAADIVDIDNDTTEFAERFEARVCTSLNKLDSFVQSRLLPGQK